MEVKCTLTKRKKKVVCSKRAGAISLNPMVEVVVSNRIDSNGTTTKVMLKANNRCMEVEQRVSMYSLVGRGNVAQKARRAVVRKRTSLLRMIMVSHFCLLTLIDYDGMRRMEDLQSEFDTRSEVSGSTSRD